MFITIFKAIICLFFSDFFNDFYQNLSEYSIQINNFIKNDCMFCWKHPVLRDHRIGHRNRCMGWDKNKILLSLTAVKLLSRAIRSIKCVAMGSDTCLSTGRTSVHESVEANRVIDLSVDVIFGNLWHIITIYVKTNFLFDYQLIEFLPKKLSFP